MLEVESLSTRLEPRHVTANQAAASSVPLTAASQSSSIAHDMLRASDIIQSAIKERDTTPIASAYGSSRSELGGGRREVTMDGGRNVDSQTATPFPDESTIVVDGQIPQSESHKEHAQIPSSASNSRDTSMTTDTIDRIFTPPASEGGQSQSNSQGNGHESSQESQLVQLSQLAAAQERLPDNGKPHDAVNNGSHGISRKRMADGMVKSSGEQTSTSPGRALGHSRNISTISVASTTSSRARDMGSEIKARLAYAMVKVNNGWQSHTIDQVEKLHVASQSTSPTSSNSTIHLHHGASASPQLSASSHRGSASSTPATRPLHTFTSQIPDSHYAQWKDFLGPNNNRPSPTDAQRPAPSLGPPVIIQPAQRIMNPRRNSHARHPPPLAVHSHQASPATGPDTPGQPSPYPSVNNRTPLVDAALFSPHGTPHQNVREQDAMEALLFMSSPGNSANLKQNFPSSSQPVRSNLQRTALPTARKSLPTGRPQPPGQPQPQGKRVGFQDEMDVDPPSAGASQPKSRGYNGFDSSRPPPPPNTSVSRSRRIPPSAGLSPPRRDRKALGDADIHRMMAAVEATSDSEGEIEIPARPQRTVVAPTVAH